jgi:predicted neuraminidase
MRAATRGICLLLAVALNGWSWLEARDSTAGFVAPSQGQHAASAAPVFREEVINPDSPHAVSHVPSVTELPDGRLAATWYAGSREGGRDVAVFLSVLAPGNPRWSSPRAIVTRESAERDLNRAVRKVGNSVVFADAMGKLWVIYVTVSIGGWSGSSLNVTTSSDGGNTWSRSERLTLSPFFNIAELVKNAPVPLADGGWAVPIYHELTATFPEILWLREQAGEIHATKSRLSAGWFGYQPALTALTRDRALAFLRDDGAARAVSLARTADGGKTWSDPAPLNLPNPDAGLDGIRLTDGRLLLAFNDSIRDRSNLRLAVSADEGQTWARVATLADEAGAEFSYPFLTQTRTGDVHLLFTWKRKAIKHIVFNSAWLDERQSAATE